jgi:hypothetical protein
MTAKQSPAEQLEGADKFALLPVHMARHPLPSGGYGASKSRRKRAKSQRTSPSTYVKALYSELRRISDLAEALPVREKDDRGGRPLLYPSWVFLLINGFVAVAGTQCGAVTEVGERWPEILDVARRCGLTTEGLRRDAPPALCHWNYWVKTTIANIDDLSDAFTVQGVETARRLGLLDPSVKQNVAWPSEGNIVRGDVKYMDPPSDFTRDEIDELTGEVKRHRVDPASRTGRRGGDSEDCWGSPFLTSTVRVEGWHMRAILGFEYVAKGEGGEGGEGGEAKMFHASLNKLRGLAPGVHGGLYDGAIRGHVANDIARDGLLIISPPAAHRVEPEGTSRRRGKRTEKNRLIETYIGESGACRHNLHGVGGSLHEAVITDRGEMEMVPLDFKTEHRPQKKHSNWYHVVAINCPHGEHLRADGGRYHRHRVPITQQSSDDANHFQRAEYLRQLPAGTPGFDAIYLKRKSAETVHSEMSARWYRGRIPAYGRERQLLMLIGFGMTMNSLALYLHAGRPDIGLAA